MKWNRTKKLVVFAMFGAVIFLLAFDPLSEYLERIYFVT